MLDESEAVLQYDAVQAWSPLVGPLFAAATSPHLVCIDA